jgi:hypothetical protein
MSNTQMPQALRELYESGKPLPPFLAQLFSVSQVYENTPVVPPTKEQLLQYANEKQTAVLSAGVVINNIPVSTTTDGRVDLSGAVSLATLVPEHIFDWVTNEGSIQLTAQQIQQIGIAVGLWVQATYSTLGIVLQGVNNETITDRATIDTMFSQFALPITF